MDTSDDSTLLFHSSPRTVSRERLRRLAETLQKELAGGRTFCCLLTGDDELRRLNREFRGKDQPTDVLSFPSTDPAGSLGDIAISVDRAAEQAHAYGHGVDDELAILMLHGVLHLLGFDHEREDDRMTRIEIRWRRKLNLPPGLIERVNA